MTTYRALEGTDVVLGSLTVLDPQPDERHGGGIQYASVRRAADGTIVKEGPFFPFRFEQLSEADYATILGVFGLDDSDNTDVTVYVRDVDLSTFVRMNGVAQRPFPGDTVGWDVRPLDVVIMVTDLEAAS